MLKTGAYLTLGLAFLGAPVQLQAPSTGTYELCQITLGDGSTVGTQNKPCASAVSRSGIQIVTDTGTSEPIQNCNLIAKGNVTLCFAYRSTPQTITYTVRER